MIFHTVWPGLNGLLNCCPSTVFMSDQLWCVLLHFSFLISHRLRRALYLQAAKVWTQRVWPPQPPQHRGRVTTNTTPWTADVSPNSPPPWATPRTPPDRLASWDSRPTFQTVNLNLDPTGENILGVSSSWWWWMVVTGDIDGDGSGGTWYFDCLPVPVTDLRQDREDIILSVWQEISIDNQSAVRETNNWGLTAAFF